MTDTATPTSPQLKPPAPLPKGTLHCPECMKSRHKRITFPNPKELGKHRRFIHHVVGARRESRLRYEAKKKAKQAEAKGSPLMCPECEAKGEVVIFKNPKALGVHRRFKHNVIGKNHAVNAAAAAKRKAQRHAGTQLAVLTPKENDIASSSAQDNHHALTIPTEAYAILAGSILKEIRTFADTHGFIARDFTSGVVNYLRAASLR